MDAGRSSGPQPGIAPVERKDFPRAGQVLGRDVKVIDDDGSPRGRKFFALWNPQHESIAGNQSDRT